MLPFDFLGYVWGMGFHGLMAGLLYAVVLFLPKYD